MPRFLCNHIIFDQSIHNRHLFSVAAFRCLRLFRVFVLAVVFNLIVLRVFAADSFFVFTDHAKWDAVNKRPFVGRDTVTRQLVSTYKHPTSNVWLVVVTPKIGARVAKYLTPAELQIFTNSMTTNYPAGWPAFTNLVENGQPE